MLPADRLPDKPAGLADSFVDVSVRQGAESLVQTLMPLPTKGLVVVDALGLKLQGLGQGLQS